MDRNEEIIQKITKDVYNKYKGDFIKKVDIYAEERDALRRSTDPMARRLAESKKYNESRDVVNESVERKMDKELTQKLQHELHRGTIKKIKQYRK